jgi:hypothetical protein
MIPVPEAIVAIDGSWQAHIPGAAELVSAKEEPTQIARLPEIDPGRGFTLTVTPLVVVQPALLVTVTL